MEIMRRGRRAVALALALAVAAGPAGARCAREEDQVMFDLAALKTELMLVAVGECREEVRYNAFINRYRVELTANERALSAWFRRTFGARGGSHQDSFVTELANLQSQIKQAQGTEFCPRALLVFSEVMALPQNTDLVAYAAGKDLLPTQAQACTGLAPVAPARPARAARRSAAR